MIAEEFLSTGFLVLVLRSCVSAHCAPDVQPCGWLSRSRGRVSVKQGSPLIGLAVVEGGSTRNMASLSTGELQEMEGKSMFII